MVAKIAVSDSSLEKRFDAAIVASVGYFLLAAATIHLTSNGRNHATIWFADALILALLLQNSRKNWPAILAAGWIGNLLANAVTREWMPGLFVYGAINMTQTYLAAWLITRGRQSNPLADSPTIARFVLSAGIIAPILGAIAGSLASAFNFGEAFVPSFVRWYISNALGLLIITPFVMALRDGSYVRCFKERTPGSRLEAAGLHTLHLIVTCGVFVQDGAPLLFLPVSTVLLLSYRLGRLGAVVGALVIALIGAATIFLGIGPISEIRSIGDQEFLYQFYMAIVLVTTLPVAGIVSSRAEAREYLVERETALRLIMTHSADGILSFDTAGVCRWAEGPLSTYLGMDPEALLGRTLDEISLHAPALAERVFAHGKRGQDSEAVFEFSSLLRPELTLKASVGGFQRNGVSIGTVVTLRDVGKRKAKDAVTAGDEQTDDLTGFLNHSGFRKHFRSAVAHQSPPTTLALVNVDQFRLINENHGHAVGDAVLAEIARRIKASTRAEDILARLGGDEFAIVLRCDLGTAFKVCERMVDAVRESPVFGDGVVSVLTSVSCGMAECHSGMSREEVFDAADAALHEVKNSGRNNVRAAA